MKSRLVVTAVAVAALGSLTACGSPQSDTATPSAQTAVTTVVTITRAPTTTPLPTETTDPTTDDTSTLQPVPTTTTNDVTAPVGRQADYVGHFQRHESTLDLASDGSGSILMGANALDGERWAVSWRAADPGITVTLVRRTMLSGAGLEAGLEPRQQFSARFTTGETGNQVLQTGPIGPQISDQIWCSIGGPSPECGA